MCCVCESSDDFGSSVSDPEFFNAYGQIEDGPLSSYSVVYNSATDDERRRVAEALRGSAYRIDSFYMLSLVIEAESCSASDVAERLADLIDPDCEEGRYSVARTVRPVDRDALLALAEEMDKWALTCDHYDWEVSPMRVVSYARRIREALEVGR